MVWPAKVVAPSGVCRRGSIVTAGRQECRRRSNDPFSCSTYWLWLMSSSTVVRFSTMIQGETYYCELFNVRRREQRAFYGNVFLASAGKSGSLRSRVAM